MTTISRIRFLLLALIVLRAAEISGMAQSANNAENLGAEKAGISVKVNLTRPHGRDDKNAANNSVATISLSVQDARTGEKLSGLRPKAWMIPIKGDGKSDGVFKEDVCQQLIRTSLSGKFNPDSQVDLNSFRLLALNSDKTITIINPQLAFSRTKLESIIELPAVGADWALSADKRLLFVTMPETSAVAVVDMSTRKVASVLSLGAGKPRRVRLQPDGQRVWVGQDQTSKVASIEVATLRLRQADVGEGLHDFAFTADSRFVFVSNSGSDSVTQIETDSMARRQEFKVGQTPVTLAYSPASRFVYVGALNGGNISVIDPERAQLLTTVAAKRGIVSVRFDPAGRFGVVVNQLESSVSVLDSAQNVLIATGGIVKEPDQVNFTERYAYVRGLGSEKFALLDLNDLRKGKVAPVEIQSGQKAPATESATINISDMIAPTPEGNSVLIANAADRVVYYYTEGLMAPMGTLSNYKRAPLALLLWDNGLAESQPGTYLSNFQLPNGGHYVVPVFLEQPRFDHCFVVNVEGSPKSETQLQLRTIALFDKTAIPVGQSFKLKFSLFPTESEKAVVGLRNLRVLVMESQGVWQQRHWAKESSPGVYEVEQVFANKGDYILMVTPESVAAKLRPVQLRVVDKSQ